MFLKNLIIYFFVTSLLSSSLSWAGQFVFDDKNHDSYSSQSVNAHPSANTLSHDHNTNLMHHLIEKHQGNHDCHMSAHLIGLHSNTITIASFNSAQIYSPFTIQYSTHKTPPPNKPPRV